MGRNVVQTGEQQSTLSNAPPYVLADLTDGTAVCNCPRGGNEAMQIEVQEWPVVVVPSHLARGYAN